MLVTCPCTEELTCVSHGRDVYLSGVLCMADSHEEAYEPPPSVHRLLRACREGDEQTVREILGRKGGSKLWCEIRCQRYETSLMAAARAGHLGIVKLLVGGVDGKELKAGLEIRVREREEVAARRQQGLNIAQAPVRKTDTKAV